MGPATAERHKYSSSSNISVFPKERGSDAFPLENEFHISDRGLRTLIESYLGEYRFELQKYNYSLLYAPDVGLTDKEGNSLEVNANNAVVNRKRRGFSTHREEAELRALQSLHNDLAFVEEKDTLFWASPPGPKSEGYGDYGFLFVGKVKEASNTGVKKIAMTAIRIDNPTIEQYNRVMSFLTGKPVEHCRADEFLEDPRVVVADIDMRFIDRVLTNIFSYDVDEEKQKKFARALTELDPFITDVIKVIRVGSTEEKVKAFHALENYALELKTQEVIKDAENVIYIQDEYTKMPRLSDIIESHGYEPPRVNGSCGSSNSVMEEILGIGESDEYGSLTFTCPACGHMNKREKGKFLELCQNPNCSDPTKVACKESKTPISIVEKRKQKEQKIHHGEQ